MLDQHKAPVWEALEEMRREKLVPFDVPGHKRGRGNKELMDFLGERCLSVDVNSTKYLDSLFHTTGQAGGRVSRTGQQQRKSQRRRR